jgi:hypothetical protein
MHHRPSRRTIRSVNPSTAARVWILSLLVGLSIPGGAWAQGIRLLGRESAGDVRGADDDSSGTGSGEVVSDDELQRILRKIRNDEALAALYRRIGNADRAQVHADRAARLKKR